MRRSCFALDIGGKIKTLSMDGRGEKSRSFVVCVSTAFEKIVFPKNEKSVCFMRKKRILISFPFPSLRGNAIAYIRGCGMQKVEICGVDTSGLPKLSAQENDELMKRLKQGDKAARDKFIVGNMRLVLSLVKRFRIKNLGADDVFQAGCVGLIKAIDGFDLSVGVKFSTYAVPMIVGEIKRYLRDGNSLRVSRSIRDMAYRVLKAREEIESRDEEATIGQISEALHVAEREVVYALDAISDPVSLYEPVYNKSGDTLLLMDQLADEKNTDETWTERVALGEAMEKLGEREKRILFLRYYEGKTQTEISAEVGISQAQVSRLEKNALQNIRLHIS